MVRAVIWIIRKLLLFAPCALLILWGYSYLKICFYYLLDPKRPIELTYKAPAGTVHVRADSYLVDPKNGIIYLRGLRLQEPKGGVVASAQLISVSNLKLSRGASQSPRIEVVSLTGSLVRKRNGQFQLADLIPKSTQSNSSTPFQVTIKYADINLIDEQGKPWEQRVQSKEVHISGAGSDWVAFGSANLPGMGAVTARVQNAADLGLQVEGETDSLNGTLAARHFLDDPALKIGPEFRKIGFTDAVASGPFKIFVAQGKKVAFHGWIAGSAKNVTYRDYRVDRATFAGQIGIYGIQGKADATLGENRAEVKGSAEWKNGFTAGGNFIAKLPSLPRLPSSLTAKIPKGLAFSQAVFQGWMGYQKGKSVLGQAEFTVDSATYRSEVATQIKGSLFADQGKVRVDLKHLSVAGTSPTGVALIDLTKKNITAYAEGTNVQLEDVGRLTHTSGLAGTGSAKAFVTGRLSKPEIEFQATGSASYRKAAYRVGPDDVQMAGSFRNNRLLVRRGYISGVDGLLAVSGSSSPSGSALNLDVEARNFHPGRYVAHLDGVASLSAHVTGSYENPKATGILRGENLQYEKQKVPAAVATFTADKSHIYAQQLQAISGTMDLEGRASYAFPSKKLSGRLSLDGLELAQFLGDKAAGIINAPTVDLSGTLSKPVAVVRLEGSNLIFGDLLVDNVEALATATPQRVVLDHATSNFAGGSISASGGYDIRQKIGSVTATSTALDLEKLAPLLGEQVTVKGTASLTEGKVTYKESQLFGSAKGKLEQVFANGARAGDGNWSAAIDGDTASGEVSIGELIPELRVVDASAKYNLKTKELSGTIDADRAHVRDLIAATLRYLPGLSAANEANALSITGDLTLGATFSGHSDSPDLLLKTLDVSNLSYQKENFGQLTAADIERKDRVWTIPGLKLSGPEGSVSASGRVEETGQIVAKASAQQLIAKAFAPFVPGLADSAAVANFTASASGKTKAPDLTGEATLEHLVKAPADGNKPDPDRDLAVTVSRASLINGSLGIQSTFRYDGFTGAAFGTAPFACDKGFGDGSVQAHVVLDQRQLKDLPLVDQFVDPARSSGTISGDIALSGPVNNIAASGGLKFSADSLGLKFAGPNPYIKGIDDDLKKVLVSLSVTGDRRLALAASADETRGGSVYANLSTPLPELSGLFNGSNQTKAPNLRENPVAGEFGFKDFTFRQSLPGGVVGATLNGKSEIGGTVSKPAIGTQANPGTFVLTKVDSKIPALPSGGAGGGTPSIDPTFNLNASLGDSAHIQSASANLYFGGSGSLEGSLLDPIGKGSLVVAKGSIVLPGGTVRLDQGGTVNFGYRRGVADDSSATLDVDLQGHTSITAIRYGQNTQRYDITVDITGNLLQDNGLHFDAISDPPDLSSDDVLALLGQKSLLESLGSADQNDAERRVRDALVSFALPSVLDPYTSVLAQSLGLDFISFEYNSVDLATVDVARSISPDFTLQYRQQVGAPPPGYRAIYDFRVVYSPKRGPSLFRRLSLSAGFDQDRPWKVALEYGTRFGGYSGPAPKTTTIISSPTKP